MKCSRKYRSLVSILIKLMGLKQKRIFMKTFVESQFGHCPFSWIFHNRNIFPLRIVYDDYTSLFEDLLNKGK